MTLTVTGDQGRVQYAPDLEVADVIDAADATFTVDPGGVTGKALSNPVSIRDAANVRAFGGTILGQLSQTEDWAELYKAGNSTATYAKDAPNVRFDHWRIDRPWDGMRVSHNCDGFLIADCWISNGRDDGIENDKLNRGTVKDCLLDGVFAGISFDPSTGNEYPGIAEKTVTLDGVLMRLKAFLKDGELRHTSPLKMDMRHPMPKLRIVNSVIAIERPDHGGQDRLARAWTFLTPDSAGNVFLNLSDDPLPSGYPLPPAGWLVMHGPVARAYWQDVRDEWVAGHADMALPGDEVPDVAPEPQPEPTPSPRPDVSAEFAAVEAAMAALKAKLGL